MTVEKFKNDREAIEYGKQIDIPKTGFILVEVADEKVILCGTSMAHEDSFYEFAESMMDKFHVSGDPSVIRDKFIEDFEHLTHCRFLIVSNEF